MIKFATINIIPMVRRNELKGSDFFEYGGLYDKINELERNELIKSLDNNEIYAVNGFVDYTIDTTLYQYENVEKRAFRELLKETTIKSCDIIEKLTNVVGDFEIKEKENGQLVLQVYTCKKINGVKYEVKTKYKLKKIRA